MRRRAEEDQSVHHRSLLRIRSTRISVELILEWIASGATTEEILDSYPHLEREDVEQAVRYAALFLENEVVITTEVKS